MLSVFLKGLLIGLIASAPVGPIAVLCLQRTLNKGRASGIATAMGASLSDLVYAIVAIFSMSMIIDFIEKNEFYLSIIGSIIVIIFGIHTFRDNPTRNLAKQEQNDKTNKNYVQDFVTSFCLTITNPLVIFLFIALFAKFSFVTEETTFLENICGIVFIMTGAFIWWTIVVNIVNMFRDRFNIRRLNRINQITGIVLVVLAVISLIATLNKFGKVPNLFC
ncbi:MAG: LysE family transporter [Paludibacteraceae bacterium]|nr:LysE family transporter [Paludibacteraceae bacterium]MBR4840809.1 LysE family transporter [Paludibacteraceae bacterium]